MSRPTSFPHRYVVRLEDRRLLAAPRAPIAVGPPPQFGGTDTVWSPEELLVGAALECFWTTFEAHARRDHVSIGLFAGTAEAVLDRSPEGPVFTSITLFVEIEVATHDIDHARRLVETAQTHCIVSRALRAPVTVRATVSGALASVAS
jgi:organic hydroperoxide reductase OsmC/OhrA